MTDANDSCTKNWNTLIADNKLRKRIENLFDIENFTLYII